MDRSSRESLSSSFVRTAEDIRLPTERVRSQWAERWGHVSDALQEQVLAVRAAGDTAGEATS